MKKRLSLVLLNLLLCFSALAVLCGYTATAKADDPEYTVKFWLDEGKNTEYAVARQTVKSGDCAVVPVTPTKEGNFFLYWKLGADKFSFKTPITENTDLTAEWLTPDESVTVTEMFNVKFVVDGTVVNEQNVEKGKDAIAPTGFDLPDGQLFLNWDRTFANVQEDIVVTANLTAAEYTVKVIGFNDVEITTISGVHYGDPVDTSSIVIPSVDNYHVDETDKFTGNTYCITSDSEIYVNYIPNEYTATFKVGEEVYGAVQTVNYGEYVECPTIPEKQGYIFKGWYIEGAEETAFDFNTLIESNVTLFAKYQIIENKKYDVTFYNYDGVQYGAVQRVEEGKTAIPAGRPAREGYEFLGWYIIGDTRELYDFDTPVIADISLNAVFKINEYTVTVLNDGEVISEQKVKYGGNATEPQVEVKEGYIFTGFDASFKDIRKDTTINATFRLKTFAVMFIDTYGKKMCATQYVEYGKSAKAPKVPELEGYTFLQWSANYEEIKDDVSIIPLYEKITYEFTYMLGDETYDTLTVEYGHTAISLVPTKDGYIFRGWFTDESLEEIYAYDFTKAVKEEKGTDFVLYGAFDVKPAEQFTVTFTVDSAIFAMYSVEYGHNCPTPNMPNKYGYIFKGWDGEYSNVTEDLVIAANFEKMKFTVRPTGFMGAGAEHEFQVEYGTYLTNDMFPENVPDKEGYTFVGWNYDATMPVTQDITVFAGYTINVYTVTFIVEGEEYDVQDVDYNSHASVPNQPYIEGKTFEGWYVKDTEDKFDFRSGVKANVVVVATFSKVTRTVYYYLDNQPYGEPQSVEVGAKLTKLADPELPEHTEFFGWDGLPEDMIMPNYNINVYGYTRTHSRVVLSYMINGILYEQQPYYDGDKITLLGEPSAEELINLTDADTKFIAWEETPTYMPTYNIRVNAVLKKYYYAKFSIAGYYNEQVRVLEGDPVPERGDPELTDISGYRFMGWDYNGFEVMPEHDIVIIGSIMRNYTIRYYVDEELYATQEVFQGEAVTPLGLPTEDYDNFVVDGWDDVPETMPTEDVRVNAVIRLKYTVTYYIDNDVCATVKIPVGDDIPEYTPETDETTTRFVKWLNLPTDGKMPAENLNIYSQVKHCYTLTYKVNGEVYHTERLFEDEPIELIEYSGSIEGMVFVEWNERDVLEFMPANDYTINAVLRTLVKYPIIYYAYGIEFRRFEIYEGYPVTPLTEVPELAYDNEEFFGWLGEPENGVMPAREVVVYADIRGNYKLTYIVDGEVYFEDTILQGTLITMLEYRGTREDIEFIAWDRTITEMPGYDIVITATIRKFEKHTLTYYINNEIFDTREYYATKPVTPYGTPQLNENEIFDGWDNEPETMPNYDMDVYGHSHIKEDDLAPNRFVLDMVFSDEKELTFAFRVKEDVKVGGFIGTIVFDESTLRDCKIEVLDDMHTTATVNGNEIRFAWTAGDNITDETTFITIYFGKINPENNGVVTLNIFEAYAWDESGEIVPADCVIN